MDTTAKGKGPLRRRTFTSEKSTVGDGSPQCGQGRPQAEEKAEALDQTDAGPLFGPRPRQFLVSSVSICLCHSFLLCKSRFLTLTLPSGVSCGSET